MIPVQIRCNLDDVCREEKWPEALPARPVVGDYIESAVERKGCVVRLVVVGVTWKCATRPGDYRQKNEWYLEVELHLPKNFVSVAHWEAWYDNIRGKLSDEGYRRRSDEALKAASLFKG